MRANGSGTKNYGEKRIAGHAESGDGSSMKIQRADARKVLGSVHKTNVGGNAVVLDRERSYTQKKRIGYEKGQHVMQVWVPTTEKETVEDQKQIL